MPNGKKTTRKLRAILSADVKGYSLLMVDDEAFTIKTLKDYRSIMSTLIQKHNGRVVDAPGDNLLADFSSVVDAVECAVEIQKRLKSENDQHEDDKKLQYRIGVNIGDVVQDGDRIYGNGVNVASRIEGLAEPGGICISRNAYDHIRDKLNCGYEYLGEHTVKNIKRSIRVYKLLIAPEDAGKIIGDVPKPVAIKWIWATALLAVIVIASVVWQVYQKMTEPEFEPAMLEEMAYPLPDKPSIAVLAFDNLSGDPKQEYFSDGIVNDLITDLSKVSGLFIISRNSAFIYKDKSIPVNQIAEELGVKYVLEGNVRKNENKIRINAQLTDATTGYNMWADRYDVNYADIFELQDQITRKIVAALAVKLTSSEQEQISSRDTDNLDAYDAYLQGREYAFRLTPDDFGKASKYFEKAIELDPDYFTAYAGLSMIYFNSHLFWWHESLGVSYPEAARDARQYLNMAMKKPTALTYSGASQMNLNQRLHQEALEAAEKALALDPNEILGYISMAQSLIFSGRPKEAIEFIKSALRRDPRLPGAYMYYLGVAHFCLRQTKDAVAFFERAAKYHHPIKYQLFAISAYAHFGREKEAKAMLVKTFPDHLSKEVLQRNIKWIIMKTMPFNDLETVEYILEGLIKAGLPEQPYQYYKILKENRLSGDEISALVFGRTTTGFIQWPPAAQYWLDRDRDGKATHRGGRSGDYKEGRSWVENDKLCNQWPESNQGRKICFPVFRNPDGSYEEKNEYIGMIDGGIVAFSPLD